MDIINHEQLWFNSETMDNMLKSKVKLFRVSAFELQFLFVSANIHDIISDLRAHKFSNFILILCHR